MATDPSPDQESTKNPVYMSRSDPWRANGLKIYVASEIYGSFRIGTIGGFLNLALKNDTSLKNGVVGITSAHVFEPSKLEQGSSTSPETEGSLFEFDIDDTTESDYDFQRVHLDDHQVCKF